MTLDERVGQVRPHPDSDRATTWVIALPVVLATLLLASIAGVLAGGSAPVLALTTPLLLTPLLVWKSPRSVVYLLLGAAVLIEQFGYGVGPRAGAVTSQVPLFHGVLPAGLNPVEVLLVLGLLVVLMQSIQRREPFLRGTAIQRLMLAVIAFVCLYLIVGVSGGGDLHSALWEVRPFFYLFGTYVLAAALIDDFAAVRPLLWIWVVGSGVKAVYGLSIFVSVRHVEPRPEAVLAHEESFFFGVFIIATVAMWLFRFRDRIRTVATLLLPLVLACNMVNSRRTAWLILMVGVAVVGVVALVVLRSDRKVIATVMAVGLLGAAVYLPAFWSSNSTLAQPARAVRSAVAPDARDLGSNDYRITENYNLQVYIGESHSTGVGFGKPISYFGLVDLLEISPILAYVPHNGVLYLWWRMGIAGVSLFAILVSQAVISSARLAAAARRREVAMMGAIGAATVFAYVAMGGTDMGFFWFRNAIAMGIMMGVVDGLARSARGGQPDDPTEVGDRSPADGQVVGETAPGGGERSVAL